MIRNPILREGRRKFLQHSFVLLASYFSFDLKKGHAFEQAHGLRRVSSSLWNELARLPGVMIADTKQTLPLQMQIFFDPNCPWCADLWKLIYPDIKQAAYHTYWIPVAYMHKNSAGKIASILKHPSPSQSLDSNFKKFDRSRRQGASSIAVVSDELSAMLKRIEGRWTQLGEATPLLIWRDKSDQVIQQIGLLPEDYLRRILSELRVHHSLSRY